MSKQKEGKQWEDLLALAKAQEGHLDSDDIEEYLFFQGIKPGSEKSFEIVQKLQQKSIRVPENLWFLSSNDTLLGQDLEKPSTSLKNTSREALEQNIERVLSSLTSEEYLLLRLRFGIGIPVALSREEVARKFNWSLEQVRAIESKALGRLRALETSPSRRSSTE